MNHLRWNHFWFHLVESESRTAVAWFARVTGFIVVGQFEHQTLLPGQKGKQKTKDSYFWPGAGAGASRQASDAASAGVRRFALPRRVPPRSPRKGWTERSRLGAAGGKTRVFCPSF